MANDTKYGYLISPAPQFLDTNGKPISGGKLKVYIAGTTTKVTTYSDWNLTKNTWPIVLDAMGTCQVIVYSANLYKFVLESAEGEEPLITRDNVSVSSEQQIIYTTANRVDSSDGTVDVTATTDPDTGMVTYDLSIQKEIDRAEEAEGALAEDIADEIDRAKTAEKAAKTEVAQGSNVSVAESTGANGQKVYTVGVDLSGYKTRQTAVTATGSATKTVAEITQDANGNMTVTYTGINFPVKSVTSSDNSVTVTNDGNGNLDLSVSIPSDSQTYGIFTSLDGSTWRKTSGNIDSLGTLDDANYHYTVIVPYSVSTLRNVIDQISLAGGKLTDKRDIDLSYVHTGYVEFSADKKTTVFAPVITMPTGVGIYPAAYLFVHSTAGGSSGGGSGDNDKVAVESGAVAGFLKDVLVSASDMVTLVPSGNRLLVNVNLDYSSDPKLATMDESQVDGATSNYGSYQLKSGADKLQWGDDTFQTFDWLNAQVYQCMRLSDAQGTITKCNVALCGSLGFQSPAPCFNVGIFDALTGELLGQSGLKFYGEDFSTDEEICEVDMVEASEGSLTIKRNMRYIIQVWTCGLQLAGLDRSTNYNYTYDYKLRQNLQTTTSLPKFVDVTAAMSRASTIPMVSFGAESLL